VNVGVFAGASRGPRLLEFQMTPAAGVALGDLEAALYAELRRVESEPLADWEMEKARNASRRQLVNLLDSSLARAQTLAQYAIFYGDPGVVNTRYERIARVATGDVQRIARDYLRPENRTVVVTWPAAAAGGGR
jgi:predicted Zn-dependent peptidase